MLFIIYRTDRPDTLPELRARLLPDHKAHVKAIESQIAFAGPRLEPGSDKVIGSLIVAEFPSLSDARAWIDSEPFTLANVYQSTDVRHFINAWPQRTGFPAS
jgi:uncharacterized protein YciI